MVIISNFRVVMVLTIIVWVIYRSFLYKKNKKINLLRECVFLLFLLYFLVLIQMTVFKYFQIIPNNKFDGYIYKTKGILGIINIIPIKATIASLINSNLSIIDPITNIVGNILLFIPLGLMIPLLFQKYNKLSKIFVLGFVSSLSIEITQLFIGDNVTDIDDIIFNTIGAIIGFLCYRLLNKAVTNSRFNNILENVTDNKTENIFRKTVKVLVIISVLIVSVYTYSVFDQTVSDKLSNKELAEEVFKDNNSKLIDCKDFEDRKLYLVKNENGLGVEAAVKYGKSRYLNSPKALGHYIKDDVGYTSAAIWKSNSSLDNVSKTNGSIVVYGKNSNADKISIRLGEKAYTFDLKKNDYFLGVYPEYIEVENNIINDINSGINNKNFEIKFLDKNNEIVKDMKFLKNDGQVY